MEIVRPQNANAVAEFYWVEIFQEGTVFENFLKNLKKMIFKKKNAGESLLLYEFSRGNQVDGSPRVAVPKQ